MRKKSYLAAICVLSLSVVFVSSCARAEEDEVARMIGPPVEKPVFGALAVEAEDFKSLSTPAGGWRVVKNGAGNDMVDIIGFNHISGERVLHADADVKNAVASKSVMIPAGGTYRVWSRFEQPTNVENRFRVEIKQNGKIVGAAAMGERDAPKYFFGSKTPVGQYDASWGSEGLVEQSFDVKDLQKGAAEISLVAVDQSTLASPRANRNVDLIFLTTDLQDSWRNNASNPQYPILDAALAATPIRYYLRLTSPVEQSVAVNYKLNRIPWGGGEGTLALKPNAPSNWLPLKNQDVAHFTTLQLSSTPGAALKIELASDAAGKNILRAIDWNDADASQILIGLPPYPNKYDGEKIVTVEEQYRAIADFLKANPSQVGRDPKTAVAWGGWTPAFGKGRVADAAADVVGLIGVRGVANLMPLDSAAMKAQMESVRARFEQWKTPLGRVSGIGAYRMSPTPENIAAAKKAATDAGVLPYLQRFDYGDEIGFSEWLAPIAADDLKTRFAAWQQKHGGKVEFQIPDSSAKAAEENPHLYVDSLKFYEETAVSYVANQAKEIPKALGSEVRYGANFAVHPFYYPEIAKVVKWFRPTEDGNFAANFGRHSEYFWQVGQPGPLVNSYVADHFRAGMRDNPNALLLQYTMPHSPGNTDKDFRRTAFSHLAHGAKGLDYFGVGVNDSFTENYIDFRDKERFAAIRDINRSMATIEDILPNSKVVPSRVALILSDSTERWDFAGIATDKAGQAVFGNDYKKVRLAYHLERLGIYYALIHASRAPDLLIEEDVQKGLLKDYDVAYWVGDCAEASTLKALETWMNNGGSLLATAGALRNDEYKKPVESGLKLLGLQAAKLDAKEWFFRPQIELPRLTPIDTIKNAGGEMPVLALKDEISALPTSTVKATFADGKPAVVISSHGKGRSIFIAALPGVAYLWSAYQNAGGKDFVPSRGPGSHLDLTHFNADAASLIVLPAQGVLPNVDAGEAKIDARLLISPNGYAIPIANYESDTTQPITLKIRGIKNVKSISSAAKGKIAFTTEADATTNTGGAQNVVALKYSPGIGDVLRIETQP